LLDNVTPTVQKISGTEQQLSRNVHTAREAMDSQNITFLAQMQVVNSLYRGLSRFTGSLKELGLVSDSTAAGLNKVVAVVGLVSGTYNMLRGAIQLVTMLRNSEAALAVVESYRVVLKNPAAMTLIIGGLAAAGAVGGYMLGKSGGGNQTTQNITISGATPGNRRSVSRGMLEAVG
jgi:hypothetical protein